MTEISEKVENFRLWWAVWILATFSMGALSGVAPQLPVGGISALVVIPVGVGVIYLTILSLINTLKNSKTKYGVWFLLIFATTLILGNFVGDWLVHLISR